MFLSLNTESMDEHSRFLNQELAELRELIALLELHTRGEEDDALRSLYMEQLHFLNEELEMIRHRKKVLMYTAMVVNETVRELEDACVFSNEQFSKLADDASNNFDRWSV